MGVNLRQLGQESHSRRSRRAERALRASRWATTCTASSKTRAATTTIRRTDQSIYQASFDMNLSATPRACEFGGMYHDFKGNQVAGWNRLTQDLIDNGTYITGSPRSLDTNGDGLLSTAESSARISTRSSSGPHANASVHPRHVAANPNLALAQSRHDAASTAAGARAGGRYAGRRSPTRCTSTRSSMSPTA